MDGLKNWLFPTSQVGEVIKFRPLSLELFYARGLDPWQSLVKTMNGFLEENGQDVFSFLHELSELPEPKSETDWVNLPSHFLIDFLTAEHRAILHSDIPAIRYLMDMGLEDMWDGPTIIHSLAGSISDFMDGLRFHITAEEDVIFMVILRNEFVLSRHHQEVEVIREQEPIYAGPMIFGREADLKLEVTGLFDGFRRQATVESETARIAERLRHALEVLEKKLKAHNRLEAGTLYPMVERIESGLRAVSEVPG